MSYWGIFPLRLRFVYLHLFAWPSPVTRYTSGWGFTFILSWFPSEASLEPFIQTLIFLHLVAVMLLIPRDVSLMFGFDVDYIYHTFDDGWFHVTRFLTYHIFDAILGHISLPVEIYRSSWSRMIMPTYEIHVEMMIYLLSYHDLPVEPFFDHSVRPTPFDIWVSSCFSFWETLLWSVDPIQLWIWMARFTYLVMDDLVSSGFLTYHTSDAILGYIPFLVEIYRFPLICMTIPSYEMHVGLMIWLRFALILWWSLSWVIQLGPYFLMLSWLLYVVISDA